MATKVGIQAVFFDVGETLVDETRLWGLWADWLGIPRLTFFAALGTVISGGGHHREVFHLLAPGLDLDDAARKREAVGCGYRIEAEDLYPDALPCLLALKQRGLTVGIAGNQPEAAELAIRKLGAPADFVASSASWGIEKPSLAFFERIVSETGLLPAQIAYVGDRLDNDILPALEFGFAAILIERGPWGVLHARKPEARRATAIIRSLDEVAQIIARAP